DYFAADSPSPLFGYAPATRRNPPVALKVQAPGHTSSSASAVAWYRSTSSGSRHGFSSGVWSRDWPRLAGGGYPERSTTWLNERGSRGWRKQCRHDCGSKATKLCDATATHQSARDDVRPVLGKLRDDRGIEVQRFGDHIRWTMRQPIGQRDLLEPVRPEDLHEYQVRVARVLDVMAKRLFYVADVTRVKVCGHCRRPGVEGRHARGTLEKIGPFIGIRMPVHLSQAARLHLNPC